MRRARLEILGQNEKYRVVDQQPLCDWRSSFIPTELWPKRRTPRAGKGTKEAQEWVSQSKNDRKEKIGSSTAAEGLIDIKRISMGSI